MPKKILQSVSHLLSHFNKNGNYGQLKTNGQIVRTDGRRACETKYGPLEMQDCVISDSTFF